jgi:four helix bundle protein
MPFTYVVVDLNLNVNATLDMDLDGQLVSDAADTFIMLSFQNLRVYQRSIDFLALVMEVVAELPKGHAELADQLLRAAQSQPRNIAEGAGRRTRVDQARFYTHARGSAMEAAAALDTMRVMKLVADARYTRGIDLLEAIVAMLTKMT